MKIEQDPQPVPPSRSFLLAVFILLSLLTALMTYPQVFHMRDGVNDSGDPLLNTWAMAWVAHQMPIAPARLFDANIFYPQRHTLAFSETLLLPAVVLAPVQWAGGGSIFVYNLALIGALVLSGVGIALLVSELTGRAEAAIVSAIIFAFLPFRFDHYSHLQLQQTEFIPLALWALHRVVRTARRADVVKLGVFAACQFLSCVYFGVFLVPYLAVMAASLLIPDLRLSRVEGGLLLSGDFGAFGRRILALAAAAAIALVIVAPTARAYLLASRDVGQRTAAEVAIGNAKLTDYLAPGENNVLYYRPWASRFGGPEHRLFPGLVAVLLAVVALSPPWSRIRIAYGLALLLAFDISRGFDGLSYGWLYDNFLPLRAIRVPARMGLMTGFTLAVLAGYGVARLSAAAGPSRSLRVLVAAILSALILFEYRSHPLALTIVPTLPPAVYQDLLRDRGDAQPVAIAELPIAREDPTFMYYSTFHWQYLLNGYSGFFSPAFSQLITDLKGFPDDTAMLALRKHIARYVVIHGEWLNSAEYERLVAAANRRPDLKVVAQREWQGARMSLYRVLYDLR
jgi:hypothetical protein